MALAAADGLQVHRLRLHGGADARSRGVIDAALSDIGTRSIGMAETAWLVVRHVACRGPTLTGSAQDSPLRAALVASLSAASRRAVRPWREQAAASCTAVCFADEVELLACLLSDWLRGRAVERWWWRDVLAGNVAERFLQQRVLGDGAMLVAVAARLSEHSGHGSTVPHVRVAEWFARLDHAQASAAFAAVARVFALPAPAPARSPLLAPAPVSARTGSEKRGDEAAALAHLERTVPELQSQFSDPAQRRLLAQCLALIRSPTWARSSECAVAVSMLGRAVVRGQAMSAGAEGPRPASRSSPSERRRHHAAAGKADRRTVLRARDAGDPSSGTTSRRSQRSLPDDVSSITPLSALSEGVRFDATSSIAPRAPTIAVPAAQGGGALAGDVALSVHAVHTRYGGAFYLLNAALALGLYGDFTDPRPRGLALSPWDWLALVGRHWFGDAFTRDPIWPMLAALAKRRRRPPQAGFAAPSEWSINPAWLDPWEPPLILDMQATRMRLRIHHGSAGFLLFDVARRPGLAPLAHARLLCRDVRALRDASLRRLPSPTGIGRSCGTARWLKWLVGYLEARLTRALGTDTGAQGTTLLCCHEARVRVRALDVIVESSLAALPLEIRLAGLDRDTGWIPAAGRSVRFCFT